MEEEWIDVAVVRAFAGIDLPEGSVADGSTIQSFRHLLKKKLAEKILKEVNQCLEDHGLLTGKGTVVDATIINAPSWRKKKRERDQEMHQTRKGNQCFFSE